MNILSIVNHVFLPIKLPQKADNDVYIYPQFFKLIIEALNSVESYKLKEIIRLFSVWSLMQINGYNTDDLANTIKCLKENQTLALYLEPHNACLLITMLNKSCQISFFQVSEPNEEIMSLNGDIVKEYPSLSVHMIDKSVLFSSTFIKLLSNMANCDLTEIYPKTRKANTNYEESRDVPLSKCVSEWLLSLLETNKQHMQTSVKKIRKKVRDDIIWQSCLQPFRRSGEFSLFGCCKSIENNIFQN